MKNKMITTICLAIIIFTCSISLNAGIFERSTIKAIYAKEIDGNLGLWYNGVKVGINFELKEDFQYVVAGCEGFALYCSYDEAVILKEREMY